MCIRDRDGTVLSKHSLKRLRRKLVRKVRPRITGNPLRGRKRFVAYRQHHNMSSWDNHRAYPLLTNTRVHHKNEYKYVKGCTVREALNITSQSKMSKEYTTLHSWC
eukprot:TRINITY_DN14146_c0_g2_i3.p2 TRINITY_DN14146_c0_g2~~TRINITY_DN14146_c0_g2_i3.p2  ORF type:complete len:106 (+),score=7.99 TRINITY_DN14146_c0_g2_i3:72-389(+)